jgi:hypothetical protein
MEHSGIEGSITEALLVLRDMVAYGVPANEKYASNNSPIFPLPTLHAPTWFCCAWHQIAMR